MTYGELDQRICELEFELGEIKARLWEYSQIPFPEDGSAMQDELFDLRNQEDLIEWQLNVYYDEIRNFDEYYENQPECPF